VAPTALRDVPFDPELPARLHPQVSLRAEPFGALAYHHGSRRLVFVKSETLVRVLESLEGHASAREAVSAEVGDDEAAAMIAALAHLHDVGVLDAR
jgi:putative mycofactocin binding protein MftB